MVEVFVKLLNKGEQSQNYERIPFEVEENSTIGSLIERLQEEYGETFQVFLDQENNTLRRDAIVLINGANMVSKKALATTLSKGDLIVFMIAAVGG